MKTSKNFNIYIVTTNTLYGQSLKQFLEINLGGNIHVQTFIRAESCINEIGSWEIKPNIIVLDCYLNLTNSDMDGLHTVVRIKQMSPKTIIIILSNETHIETATKTLHADACDYVTKDEFVFSEVLSSVQKYLSPLKI
ncbi:MAG: response regulator [Bacteroidetes bacterium]|nr:response regulator [Bacteroidota bacterium]